MNAIAGMVDGGDRAPAAEKSHADYAARLALDRYRVADNSHPTKHVVAAGRSVRDAGSTPAASSLRSERSEGAMTAAP